MNKLYLPNVDSNINENILRNYFCQFGLIKHCTLKDGIHHRCAFRIFESKFRVYYALEKDYHLINGKFVFIKRGQNFFSLIKTPLKFFNYSSTNVLLSFNSEENDKRFLSMRPHMINGEVFYV